MTKPETQLETALAAALHRRHQHSTLRNLSTNLPGSIDFSSNDFLSLSRSPELRAAFLAELQRDNVNFTLGSGGSRLLDGNSTYAEDLEKDIAAFHNAEAALLCNSGFDANAGLFSCLPQPGDIIIYDEYIHASVHDGMKVSRAASCLPFTHNSPTAFRAVLEVSLARSPALRAGKASVFVALEAVYSMDGDVAPLLAIANTLSALLPLNNGHLIVDEAHSTGVRGARGRGLVCELGLEARVLARLHTFGKALACNGAVLLTTPLVRQYLLNYARPLIYTTFLSFPALAAVRAAYAMLAAGRTQPLADALQRHVRLLHALLADLQRRLPASAREDRLLCVGAEPPQSPIFSVVTREPRGLARFCQDKGFVVRAIVPPTVPAGAERIRVCLHAGNTEGEIRALVARIAEWVAMMQRPGSEGRDRARL